MPEYPEVQGAAHVITKGKGSGFLPEVVGKFKFFLQIVPLCLSLGSEKHRFQSITVNREAYTLDGIQTSNVNTTFLTTQNCPQWPPPSWQVRATEINRSYLLERPKHVGPLICVVRGKLIVLAAGNHAVCICLGLEGYIFGMKTSDFLEIATDDVAGPNDDPKKAEQIRTFLIPERFIVPGSSERRPRTVKIFAAVISPEWVYVVSDFSGLVRMHVKSKDSPWTHEDLAVGSENWNYMFSSFKGGPDWVLERPLAMAAIQNWRITICEEHRRWKARVVELKANHQAWLRSLRSTLDDYFSTTRQPLPQPPSLPREPIRPIIKEMCTNSLGAFSGFGRHLANDFLYLQAIFPGTPSRIICEDNEVFEEFVTNVESYLKSFTEEEFLNSVTSVANSDNPFAFNETSNTVYMQRHILVFRRTKLMVPRELYIDYCRKGLLDPGHTIGDSYPPDKANALIDKLDNHQKYKWVNQVYLYSGKLRAYSIICAKCPSAWGLGLVTATIVMKDITDFGYTTTIGLAQFHEHLLNRVLKPIIKCQGGRPSITRTKKKGRPAKSKTTKKAAAAAKKTIRGSSSSAKETGETGRDPLFDLYDSDCESSNSMDVDYNLNANTSVGVDNSKNTNTSTEMDMDNVDNISTETDIDNIDNAGDADANGDGSASLEDEFIEYGGDESDDEEYDDEKTEELKLQILEEVVDGIIRDARHALQHFTYFIPRSINPYNEFPHKKENPHKKSLLPGIMTYRRAYSILHRGLIYNQKLMKPYFIVWLKYRTTRPDLLSKLIDIVS